MLTTRNGIAYGFYRDRKFDPAEGRTVSRLVLLMPGQGCVPWLGTRGQCCPFCRLPAGTRFAVLGAGHEDTFTPWTIDEADHDEIIATAFADSDGVEVVMCFNGGSFLTDREIPEAVRKRLYTAVAAHPTAFKLIVESRPEFITPAALAEAERSLGGKLLSVAIGLESTNDAIRNGPLKKFMGWPGFERSVTLLKERGHQVFVYVFLGAPGLDEVEAYADAEASVRRLSEMGVDEIALSCAFVPPGGELHRQWDAGKFRPPWLWTIVRLIAAAQVCRWPMTVGAFDDFPPPLAFPSNCGACDDAVHGLLDGHRETGSLDLRALPICACHAGWFEKMRRPAPQSVDSGERRLP